MARISGATSAIDGLNPGERDVIELSLRHELEGDDLTVNPGGQTVTVVLSLITPA